MNMHPLLQTVLAELKVAAENLDKNVNRLGTLKPKWQADAEVYAMARELFDPEELDRIEREEVGKGIPYSQVKKRLELGK